MIAANCDYGLHLDMNAGHCGFEYYRMSEAGKEPKLDRKLEKGLEAEGAVPRRGDLTFRARKLVDEMGNMRFPRYLSRDPRDFFYLVLKNTIFDGLGGIDGGVDFIAHGAVDEATFVSHAYALAETARSAGVRMDQWIVAEAGHVEAMFLHPEEYERRLEGFFGMALNS